MHETKGKRVNGIKEKKRIKSLEGEKKRRLLPVSLFTGAPQKHATLLSGKQREKEPLFKRKIVLPANI